MDTLSALEARRLALAAQGFSSERPPQAGLGDLQAMASRLHVLQIDAVNVLVRAHYLPLFARLGHYDVNHLDQLVYERHELFEYVGHAASLISIELYPLFRWRMALFERNARWWGTQVSAEPALSEIRERGPLAAADLNGRGARADAGWTTTPGRMTLAWLAAAGQISVVGRRGFQPVFDLTERVIPQHILARQAPGVNDAKRALLLRAAQALGVATADDLAEYFYLDHGRSWPTELAVTPRARRSKDLVAELAAEGSLIRVQVEGWTEAGYVLPNADPSPTTARALVSPFDSLMWNRKRLARTFGFEYRLEMYLPKEQRQHGYYTLPFLLGDSLVARVDLKADRKAGVLRVQSAFAEPLAGAPPVARELAAELWTMARWLGLERIAVDGGGDLAGVLAAAVLRPPD